MLPRNSPETVPDVSLAIAPGGSGQCWAALLGLYWDSAGARGAGSEPINAALMGAPARRSLGLTAAPISSSSGYLAPPTGHTVPRVGRRHGRTARPSSPAPGNLPILPIEHGHPNGTNTSPRGRSRARGGDAGRRPSDGHEGARYPLLYNAFGGARGIRTLDTS